MEVSCRDYTYGDQRRAPLFRLSGSKMPHAPNPEPQALGLNKRNPEP